MPARKIKATSSKQKSGVLLQDRLNNKTGICMLNSGISGYVEVLEVIMKEGVIFLDGFL